MKARTRKILLLIFFLIFIILTILIIFYCQGYRFDWVNKTLVKTGNLYLVSHPSQALVFLDHRLYKPNLIEKLLFYKNLFGLTKLRSFTPTLINYLFPKEHLVILKKEGYSLWQKKIKIIPEKTIIFKDILLFKEKPEVFLIRDLSLLNFKFSPRLKKIAGLNNSQKKLIIFDLETNKEKVIELKDKIKDFSWFPSEEKLIIFLFHSDYPFFVNLSNNSLINLKDFLKQKVLTKDIKVLSEEKISFHDQHSIYQFDLVAKKLDSIYYLKEKTSSLIDFLLQGNFLFYLKKEKDKFFLEGFDLESKKLFYSLEIPINENYKFVPSKKELNNFIFLYDKENIIAFNWYEEKIEKAMILKAKAKNFDFNNKKIIYHDGYEISSFDFEKKNKETIERTSEEILKILFHPKGNYLFILFPQKIKILEISSLLPINYVEYNFEKVVDLKPTRTYNFVYFLGKIGEKEGIFKIKIQ